MLAIGDTAPEFELKDDAGQTVRLSDLLAGGPLVLYFYPADFTPTCTREACMFRDAHQELAARGLRVVGVNASRRQTHARFRARLGLPFILLSDPERTAARSYGAAGLLGFVRRISYLIGADAKILDAVRADLRLADHKDFVSRLLDRMKG
jgi:thioredoxin-dependent peroxiredoxin